METSIFSFSVFSLTCLSPSIIAPWLMRLAHSTTDWSQEYQSDASLPGSFPWCRHTLAHGWMLRAGHSSRATVFCFVRRLSSSQPGAHNNQPRRWVALESSGVIRRRLFSLQTGLDVWLWGGTSLWFGHYTNCTACGYILEGRSLALCCFDAGQATKQGQA